MSTITSSAIAANTHCLNQLKTFHCSVIQFDDKMTVQQRNDSPVTECEKLPSVLARGSPLQSQTSQKAFSVVVPMLTNATKPGGSSQQSKSISVPCCTVSRLDAASGTMNHSQKSCPKHITPSRTNKGLPGISTNMKV